MSSKPSEPSSYRQVIKEKLVTFTYRGAEKLPPFKSVTSVSAIPFTEDGRIVVVNLRHRGYDLPGGHVEPGEKSPQQTLEREVMEEACLTLRNPTLAEVIESDYFEDRPSFMLLYAAYVDTLLPFIPNDEASERIILKPNEFIEQYSAGDKELLHKVVEKAWTLLTQSKETH